MNHARKLLGNINRIQRPMRVVESVKRCPHHRSSRKQIMESLDEFPQTISFEEWVLLNEARGTFKIFWDEVPENLRKKRYETLIGMDDIFELEEVEEVDSKDGVDLIGYYKTEPRNFCKYDIQIYFDTLKELWDADVLGKVTSRPKR